MNKSPTVAQTKDEHKGLTSSKGIYLIAMSYCFINEIATDIFIPALPNLAKNFHVTTEVFTKSFFSYFIYVFYICSFFVALLSDSYDRKKIFSTAYLLSGIGFFISGIARTSEIFFFGRVLQGLGIAAVAAIHPAIQESLPQQKAMALRVKMGSYGGLFNLTIPLLGSVLLDTLGSRSPFFFAGASLMALALCSHTFYTDRGRKSSFQLKATFKLCFHLLKNPAFLAISLCSGLIYAATVSFIVKGAPFFSDELSLDTFFYRLAIAIYSFELFFSGYVGAFLSKKGLSIRKQTCVSFGCLVGAGALFLVMPMLLDNHFLSYIIPFGVACVGYTVGQAGVVSLSLSLYGGKVHGALAAFSGLLRLVIAMGLLEVISSMSSGTGHYFVTIHLVCGLVGLPILTYWNTIQRWLEGHKISVS